MEVDPGPRGVQGLRVGRGVRVGKGDLGDLEVKEETVVMEGELLQEWEGEVGQGYRHSLGRERWDYTLGYRTFGIRRYIFPLLRCSRRHRSSHSMMRMEKSQDSWEFHHLCYRSKPAIHRAGCSKSHPRCSRGENIRSPCTMMVKR